MTGIEVTISPGEAFDRLTILEIKLERLTDSDKRDRALRAHAALVAALTVRFPEIVAIALRISDLKSVNEAIWIAEDNIRECDAKQEFGDWFVTVARSIYRLNDRRATLKGKIDTALGSDLTEPKQYSHGALAQ